MSPQYEKRLLQITVAIGGIVPVTAGLAGVILGPSAFEYLPYSISFGSHTRYLSGLLLGIGCAFWSCIPLIETKSARFRLLTFMVFVGGLARLTGVVLEGDPGASMRLALGMELVITPLLCFWQARVAKRLT